MLHGDGGLRTRARGARRGRPLRRAPRAWDRGPQYQFFLAMQTNCKHLYSFLGSDINSCGAPAPALSCADSDVGRTRRWARSNNQFGLEGGKALGEALAKGAFPALQTLYLRWVRRVAQGGAWGGGGAAGAGHTPR